MNITERTEAIRIQTEALLSEVDHRAGGFARAQYVGVDDFLAEPFMRGVELSDDNIRRALMASRMKSVMHVEMSADTEQDYNAINLAAGRWIERTNYERIWPSLDRERSIFPYIKDVKYVLQSNLAEDGLSDISVSMSKNTLSLNGLFKGLNMGDIVFVFKVDMKYAGRMSFSFHLNSLNNQTPVWWLAESDIFPIRLYGKAGFIFPRDEFLHIDHGEGNFKRVENLLMIIRILVNNLR